MLLSNITYSFYLIAVISISQQMPQCKPRREEEGEGGKEEVGGRRESGGKIEAGVRRREEGRKGTEEQATG